MISTRNGREPMTVSDLAPTDRELEPGGWKDLCMEFYAPPGVDPDEIRDEIRDAIRAALHEVGDGDIAGDLR